MGVPTFYRWLCTKYPKVVKDAVEEKEVLDESGQVFITADLAGPNPNQIEFDNLYVDMNGVVHPCCHPEDAPAPTSEAEMFSNLCDYLDRIVNIVRPRKLIYFALDGVAPRAKMNQQRSRRFKAASEAEASETAYEELKAEFAAQGRELGPSNKRWDSNCITPGTPFMDRLAQVLRYYVAKRMSESSYWRSLIVLLSDSNRPGEGEHKVMAFVRGQRQQPDYDPNTKHCMHGMDADLIMLGLSTHETHFYIVREIVTDTRDNQKCLKCGATNHSTADHRDPAGTESSTKVDIRQNPDAIATYGSFRATWKPLQFLQLPVLREYMDAEFQWGSNELLTQDPETGNLVKVPTDLERHIDDFVLMCFFVGNDFLPHLPSLSIAKGSIDQMITLYKAVYPTLGDYLTDAGKLNLEPLKRFTSFLAAVEPNVLRYDWQRKERQKQQREENEAQRGRKRGHRAIAEEGAHEPPSKAPRIRDEVEAPHLTDGTPVAATRSRRDSDSLTVESEDSLGSTSGAPDSSPLQVPQVYSHRQNVDDWKAELKKKLAAQLEVKDPVDNVALGDGDMAEGRLRYYRIKFELPEGTNVESYAAEVAKHFVRGLQWVLLYYYQGVPSWDWYFPYHYAPLACDIHKYGFEGKSLLIPFEKGHPFSPLEQLMANLPPRSAKFLPECLAQLMTDPNSEIADFYPLKFKEDQDGKRFKWQWVALLPFIDPSRLKAAMEKVIHQLTPVEVRRNTHGQEYLFASEPNPLAAVIEKVHMRSDDTEWTELSTPGLFGTIARVDKNSFKKGSQILVDCDGFPAFVANCCVASYEQPASVGHKVEILAGAVPPPPTLDERDRMLEEGPGNRFNCKVAKRMILQVVGGPHFERWREQERRELDNRRSHFARVRQEERYTEEVIYGAGYSNPLLNKSSPPRGENGGGSRYPPPWARNQHQGHGGNRPASAHERHESRRDSYQRHSFGGGPSHHHYPEPPPPHHSFGGMDTRGGEGGRQPPHYDDRPPPYHYQGDRRRRGDNNNEHYHHRPNSWNGGRKENNRHQ